jgi:4-hydroxythreonine-4-phosphate dehydrogenase
MNSATFLSTGSEQALALTMGEPAGIGGEVTLKAWMSKKTPPFFVIDDAERLRLLAQRLGLNVPVCEINDPSEAMKAFEVALPVLHQPLKDPVVFGKPSLKNAKAVMESIKLAVELVRSGQASAVVTNPIHKETLYDAGFLFPGHTEYLSNLAGMETPPVMMLASPKLKVVPVTIHVSLAKVSSSLREVDIINTARITAQALTKYFSIANPRLAIAGLNPHAGEGGKMGKEEITDIVPAITKLCKFGIDASGPWAPDTMFHDAARKLYDVAICMYHDQALIPIKTIDFDGAVNITLGLPFVRTSPDHGTAFNIAGTGVASERSLLAALEMATKMTKLKNNQ